MHCVKALSQFYTVFPALQKNQFFITGESYGGHYVGETPRKSLSLLPKNLRGDTDGRGSLLLLLYGCGSVRLFTSADARFSNDVIAFEGPCHLRQDRRSGARRWSKPSGPCVAILTIYLKVVDFLQFDSFGSYPEL